MKAATYTDGMRRQVGWFVISGISSVVLVLLLLSLRTDLFANKFHLYVSPPSAAAFHVGQAVKFQGFTIGHVHDIELTEAARVRVDLRLLERYRPMLHTDATARLVKEGLIGEQVVELTGGDAQGPVVADYDSIGYETEASIEQLLLDIKPTVAHANTLLAELAKLAVWLNDPDADVRVVLADLRQISRDLKAIDVVKTVRQLSETLTQVQVVAQSLGEQRVAEHLSASLKQTADILGKMQPLAQSLGETGGDTLDRIHALAGQLDSLSGTLNVIAADLSELTPELPGLVRDSHQAIEEVHGMLQGLRGSWLFKDDKPVAQRDATFIPPALDLRP